MSATTTKPIYCRAILGPCEPGCLCHITPSFRQQPEPVTREALGIDWDCGDCKAITLAGHLQQANADLERVAHAYRQALVEIAEDCSHDKPDIQKIAGYANRALEVS